MGDASGRPHRIAAEDAVILAMRAFTAVGAADDTASVQARHLVEAELRGHPSHGLRRLPVLVDRIRAGLIDPNARPSFEWGASGALRVDGNRGFGPVAAYAAIDRLTKRVAETGVAAAALRRTHHLGMLAPYVELLTSRGLIALITCSTEGLVHPWRGGGALLGTNPLAIGVPADGDRVILDMSTSQVSAGKILDHAERGVELPPGWAVDASGHPTQDPSAAIEGAISPFGGAKGYALGLALGSIVGALTGTEYGTDVAGTLDGIHETTKGDVIVVLDIAAFGQSAASAGLADYLRSLRQSGVDGAAVTVPGDRSAAQREESVRGGFDITDEVWRELLATSTAATSGRRA
jgi:L-2-hydroxycarboxylate dehydrogenase (NAD+)